MGKFVQDFKRVSRQYTSPVFIVFLFASFVMWYIAKLNYTYTTILPFEITINGEKIRVHCMAEGVGYRLFAHPFYGRTNLRLQLSDVKTIPSEEDSTLLYITPESIKNAITTRNSDIKIISVEEIPTIHKPQQ